MQHPSKSQSGEPRARDGRSGSVWRGTSWPIGAANRSPVRCGQTGRAIDGPIELRQASSWMPQTGGLSIEAVAPECETANENEQGPKTTLSTKAILLPGCVSDEEALLIRRYGASHELASPLPAAKSSPALTPAASSSERLPAQLSASPPTLVRGLKEPVHGTERASVTAVPTTAWTPNTKSATLRISNEDCAQAAGGKQERERERAQERGKR